MSDCQNNFHCWHEQRIYKPQVPRYYCCCCGKQTSDTVSVQLDLDRAFEEGRCGCLGEDT